MHIEVESRNERVAFVDVVRLDRGMPNGAVGLLERHAIDAAGNAQDTAFDFFVGEVLAHRLGVDIVFLSFERFGVVEAVPSIEAVGVGVVGAFERHELFDFGFGARLSELGNFFDKRGNRLRIFCHFIVGIIGGPVFESERRGVLISFVEEFFEDDVVGRVGARVEELGDGSTRIFVFGVV